MRGCKKVIMKERKRAGEKQTLKIENLGERKEYSLPNRAQHIQTGNTEVCLLYRSHSFFLLHNLCVLWTLYVLVHIHYTYLFKWLLTKWIKIFVHDFSLRRYLFILPVSHLWNQSSHTHSLIFFSSFSLAFWWQWSIVCYFGAHEKKRKYDHRIHYTCILVYLFRMILETQEKLTKNQSQLYVGLKMYLFACVNYFERMPSENVLQNESEKKLNCNIFQIRYLSSLAIRHRI